jgi:hypothetical protein
MTDSHNITFGDNQFVLNPSQHCNTVNSTVLNTGQPMAVQQHVLGVAPGMPSPILKQQSNPTALSYNDIYRIATVLRSIIHNEISLMVETTVDEQTKPRNIFT